MRESDVRQRAPDCAVHSLPDTSDAAIRFAAAVAVLAAALPDRERAFERIEDARRADLAGRTRELIAAVTAASGDHETAALKLLEQLAYGRQADARALGHFGGSPQPVRLGREAGQDHRSVIGQLAD